MTRRSYPAFAAALAVAVASVGRASAVAPQVRDDGKFFSADAIKKANEGIKEIARRSGRDLLVETFASVPADQADKVKAMSSDEKRQFFRHWAEERARDAVVNGVYVLVCKDPTYLYLDITPPARSAFNEDAIRDLRKLLLTKFHEKKYDEGLQEAVNLVQQRLSAAGSRDKP